MTTVTDARNWRLLCQMCGLDPDTATIAQVYAVVYRRGAAIAIIDMQAALADLAKQNKEHRDNGNLDA